MVEGSEGMAGMAFMERAGEEAGEDTEEDIRDREMGRQRPEAASAVSEDEATSQRQEVATEECGRTEAEGVTREEGIMATGPPGMLLIAHMPVTMARPGMSIEETGEASSFSQPTVMGLLQLTSPRLVQVSLDTMRRACHPGHRNLCLAQVLRVTL